MTKYILLLALLLTGTTPAYAHIPTPKSYCFNYEVDTYLGSAKIIYASGVVNYTQLPVKVYCVYPVIQYKRYGVDE